MVCSKFLSFLVILLAFSMFPQSISDLRAAPTRQNHSPAPSGDKSFGIAWKSKAPTEHARQFELNITSLATPLAQNDPSVADNPLDSGNIIIADIEHIDTNSGPTSHIKIHSSLDKGATWLTREAPNSTTGYPSYYFASASFDGGGNAYIAYLDSWGEVTVTKSSDKGLTWSNPAIVVQPLGNNETDDYPKITVDRWSSSPQVGAIYVTFTRLNYTANTRSILFSRSTDTSMTWSKPVTISSLPGADCPNSPTICRKEQGPMPAVGPDGTIYVAFYDSTSDGIPGLNGVPIETGVFQIILRQSTDGGTTWSAPSIAATLPEIGLFLPPNNLWVLPSQFPIITTGPNGYVYIVTTARPSTTGTSRICILRSFDHGKSWTPCVTVNDDSSGRGHFFPWITVRRDNSIHVIFGDRRDDPSDLKYNIYYTYSNDFGTSYTTNRRLTTIESDPTWNFGDYVGDYFGLSSTDQFVNAVWTDTRNAAISGQDIFATFVDAPLYSIRLLSGWNLISLPLIPDNPSITILLSTQIQTKNVVVVWTFSSTSRSWLVFIPDKSSTFTTMKDGAGYWVYMQTADTLYLDGTVIAPVSTPPSYSLIQGWNLVGFKPQPSIQSESVGQYLSSITGNYDPNNVWAYDNTSGGWIRAHAGYMLEPGQALWILMTAPATLRP